MAGCRFQLRRSFMSTPRLRAYLYSIFTGKFEGVFAFNLDDDFTNRLTALP